MKSLVKLFASGFYTGYCPVAPGTVGSLWGVVLFIFLHKYPSVFVLLTLISFFAGFAFSGEAERLFGEKDSRKIVIDEIASMCLVFLFIGPDWFMVLSGFLIFRFFDIIKPPPAKRIEKTAGAKAVMLDDLVAAAYTIAILLVFRYLQSNGILPVWNIQGHLA